MMIKYLVGALIGGLFGYFVLFKLIGCSSGACPITANPYLSTAVGVLLGAMIAGSISYPAENPVQQNAGYTTITAQEAKARMDSGDDLIIVDVRTQAEYASGHVPGAVLIPNETISDQMPALLPDLDAEVLLYCRSGNRSAQAAKKLAAMGYTRIYDFGGIIDWPYETEKEA
jgi:rhodanese-related sulfurtransferase